MPEYKQLDFLISESSLIYAVICWITHVVQLATMNLYLFFSLSQAIHVELSKLVKRQSGGNESQKWKAKPAQMLGENIAPFLIPSKKKPPVSQ